MKFNEDDPYYLADSRGLPLIEVRRYTSLNREFVTVVCREQKRQSFTDSTKDFLKEALRNKEVGGE